MNTFTAMAEEWIRQNRLATHATPSVAVMPVHDPAAWAEDFHRWAMSRCRFRDRCIGGIGALHADFCE